MIAFVSGRFITKLPSQVVVDVNGIGYELQISLNTYSAITNSESGKLYTYLHITENAHTLYGFFDAAEKEESSTGKIFSHDVETLIPST